MSIALLFRVKVFQAYPTDICFTMLTVNIIASLNLLNWCITLGATFAFSGFGGKPFLKFLFTMFSSLVHSTGQAIVVLILTLGTEVDTTVAADESLSIIRDYIDHFTVWCWAATYSLGVCCHVGFQRCCSKLLTGEICSLEEMLTVLPYEWVRAFGTLQRKRYCIWCNLQLDTVKAVVMATIL